MSDLRDQLAKLKGDDFTSADKEKIAYFEERLQGAFGILASLRLEPPKFACRSRISGPVAMITDDSGDLTARELGFEMSGSDASGYEMENYYLALLDVAVQYGTNHPCFIAFDEPDQQAIESKDVRTFLLEAAKFGERAQILVAATAEDRGLRCRAGCRWGERHGLRWIYDRSPLLRSAWWLAFNGIQGSYLI